MGTYPLFLTKMTYTWFALLKTQMFDLIVRHILEKNI